MLSTTDALIEKQISSEESHARDQARASHWVFTALKLMQLCKYLFSSKRIIILVSLYLESSLPFLTCSEPLAHTCCRWAFGWGWPQGVRALPTMLCCAILPTDTWLKYSSLWVCPLWLTVLQDIFHNLSVPSLGSMVQQGAMVGSLD